MTDREIIKALEYCTNESDGECKECGYDKYYPRCVPKLLEDALDIINRQKAEYNKLLEQFRILDCECGRLEKVDKNQKAEIEKLKIKNQALRSAAKLYKLHYGQGL